MATDREAGPVLAGADRATRGDGPVGPDPVVVDAVARLIDRGGLAALSMTAIAEEAGLSRVTLHRRGSTIEDYVITVFGRVSDALRAALWPVLTGPGSAAERLRAGLEGLCRVAEEHRGVMRALYGVAGRPSPGDPDRLTSADSAEPFERLLRDGLVDGTLTSDDPTADAVLVLNATGWTYLHLRSAHGWKEERARSRSVDTAIAQFLVDRSPEPDAPAGRT